MISINKDFNKVPTILQSTDEVASIPDSWRDNSILEELRNLYKGKCAYCETKTTELVVDHYRPINIYPWLKNEWSNLLPVCRDCEKAKGDEFPIYGKRKESASTDKRDNRADSEYLLSEKPIIIHPEVDTAENHFYFDYNSPYDYKDILGSILGNTKRGIETVKILNLNHSELYRKRSELIDKKIDKLKQTLQSDNDIVPLLQIIKNESNNTKEFSLAIKNICEDFDMVYHRVSSNIKGLKRNILFDRDFIKREIHDYIYTFPPNHGFLGIYGAKIKSFQGIKELELEDISWKTRWVFLTGDNGFGKTSILRALLLGLIGKSEFRESEIDENTRIEIKTMPPNKRKNIEGFSRIFSYNVFGSYYHRPFIKYIAAYGSKRTDLSDKTVPSVADNLFEKTPTLYDFETRFKDWNIFPEKNKQKIKNLELILKELIPNLSRIAIDKNTVQVIYYEKSEEGIEFPPVVFNKLAMGIRSIIVLVTDMIYRLTDGEFDFDIVDGETNIEGIVIIDEFDNHLHPKWQKNLVSKLSDLFPKVQFIVSTHSPIPFLGAPKNSAFFRIHRDKYKGILAKKLDIDVLRLTPNSILSSPVFGFEDINSDEVDIDEVEIADRYSNVEADKRMKEKLRILKQSDEDFFNSLKME